MSSWACTHCTYQNNAYSSKCDMCGNPRTAASNSMPFSMALNAPPPSQAYGAPQYNHHQPPAAAAAAAPQPSYDIPFSMALDVPPPPPRVQQTSYQQPPPPQAYQPYQQQQQQQQPQQQSYGYTATATATPVNANHSGPTTYVNSHGISLPSQAATSHASHTVHASNPYGGTNSNNDEETMRRLRNKLNEQGVRVRVRNHPHMLHHVTSPHQWYCDFCRRNGNEATPRYRSTTDRDTDSCESCLRAGRMTSRQDFKLVTYGKSRATGNRLVWHCDVCHKVNNGARYRCTVSKDYDQCRSCVLKYAILEEQQSTIPMAQATLMPQKEEEIVVPSEPEISLPPATATAAWATTPSTQPYTQPYAQPSAPPPPYNPYRRA